LIRRLTDWHGAAQLHPYFVCDVFTSEPLQGNQLGAFVDGRPFTTEEMQRLAREMNFAETVIQLRPQDGGDAWIRIFAPESELPFAGHPVLGMAAEHGRGRASTLRLLEPRPLAFRRECVRVRGEGHGHSLSGKSDPSELGLHVVGFGCPMAHAVYRSVCILRGMTDRPNAHDRLLGATSELTYEYGITGTGVDAIAARAGVTKRTLYQHFGSKDRLVAEALKDRNRRALLSLETNARRRSEETGELAILALFDVIENALRSKTKAGCAFINASLEINRPGHPVREAALAHLRAREGLVQQLLIEAGVEDADLAAQVVLLVDGAYAVGGSRRDPAAARHAKAAVGALLAGR
jgi:AcrR family transcriptional regulator